MMKKGVLIATLMSTALLCGCGNKLDMNEETTSTIIEQTETVSPEAYYEVYKNVYMVRNSEDGTPEYGPIIDIVSISEDKKEIVYCTRIECTWLDDNAKIPCRIMVFADEVPIKFGLQKGENAYDFDIEITNHQETYIPLYFEGEFLENVNVNFELEIMCIPMVDNTEWNTESIMVAGGDIIHSREAYNGFSKGGNNDRIKTEMTHIKSFKEIIGKELNEMTPHHGNIRDFVYEGIDGKYYYFGDYREDYELITYFMLDGKLLENENGFYSISWDGNADFSVSEIELPDLDAGAHSIFAITITKRDKNKIMIYNSFKSEGTTIEIK